MEQKKVAGFSKFFSVNGKESEESPLFPILNRHDSAGIALHSAGEDQQFAERRDKLEGLPSGVQFNLTGGGAVNSVLFAETVFRQKPILL